MIVVCSIWKSVGFGLIRFSWRLIIIDPYPKNVTFTCVQPKLAGNLDAVWAACIPQRRTRKMRLNKYMKSKTWNSKCFLVLGMFFIFGIQLASWSKVCSIQNDVPNLEISWRWSLIFGLRHLKSVEHARGVLLLCVDYLTIITVVISKLRRNWPQP